MELWQTAVQELDHLQQVHQQAISDGRSYDTQTQQLKVSWSHARHHPSGGIVVQMRIISLAVLNC